MRVVPVLAGLDQRHLHEVFGIVAAHIELRFVVRLGTELHAHAGGTHLSMLAARVSCAVAVEDDDVLCRDPGFFQAIEDLVEHGRIGRKLGAADGADFDATTSPFSKK